MSLRHYFSKSKGRTVHPSSEIGPAGERAANVISLCYTGEVQAGMPSLPKAETAASAFAP